VRRKKEWSIKLYRFKPHKLVNLKVYTPDTSNYGRRVKEKTG
jgi:hypothetical protein